MEVEDAKPASAVSVSEAVHLRAKAIKGVRQLLQDRLYDQPENSHVLQAVRLQTGLLSQTMKVPRPPPGKPSHPSAAIRTTMMKRDYNHWQNRRKQSPTIRRPVKNLEPLHQTQSQPDLSLSVIDNPQDRIISDAESKKVHFVEEQQLHDTLPPSEGLAKEPPFTPTADSPSLSNKRSSSKGSRKPDPSIVFTYMSKSVFDDTEPEKDDLVETVLEMRKALGWVIHLPRLGSEGRSAIENLSDKPDPDTDYEAAMNAKDDDGRFVYALPRNRNDKKARYNPYELQVTSANAARSCKLYWTASASNITRVTVAEGGKVETCSTPPLLWLWERRLFNLIYDLPVFQKYRKLKSFNAWKTNVDKQKHGTRQVVLQKSLFTCNEVLQGCLLHIRKMCEAACGSLIGQGEGQSAINLYLVDLSQTRTLESFLQVQYNQANQSLAKLMTLKDTVVALVWKSCVTVAEMEGVVRGIRPGSPNIAELERKEKEAKAKLAKQEEQSKLSPATKRLLEKHLKKAESDEGKKEAQDKFSAEASKPSYAQTVEWRKVLKRLSIFLRMVDYVVMEMLRRLVLTAVGQLSKTVSISYSADAQDMDGVVNDGQSVVSGDSGNPSRSSTPFKRAQSPLTSKSENSSSTSGSKAFRRYTIKGSSSGLKRAQTIPTPLTETSGYVIPHFDFDKLDDSEKGVDIEQVLEEIAEQPELEDVCTDPMVYVELVLKVPATKLAALKQKVRYNKRRRSSQADVGNPLTSQKKVVKFSAEQRPSGAKFSAEQRPSDPVTDSDYDSEENETEEAEDLMETKNWEEDVPNSARNFAYHTEDADSHNSDELASSAFIVLSPSKDQIQNSLRSLITTFENTVGQFGSLLKDPRLKTFYSPPKYDLKLETDAEMMAGFDDDNANSWPDTNSLFGNDPFYQSVVGDIVDMVKRNLEEAISHSEDFLEYCKMVDLVRKFKVDQTIAQQWSPDEFQQVLALYTDQISQMDSMTQEKRVGLFQVMTENFYNSCLPYPKMVVSTVWQVLPVLALKRNEDLLTIIEGASRKLDKTPTSVEEFVEHLSFLGKMASEMPALEKEYAIVTKLYTIAKDFEVPLNPEDLALYQTLNPSFQHLKSTILYAEAKKDENIRKFSTHLGRLINEIRRQIVDIKNKVIDPSLLNGDTMSIVAKERVKYLTEQVTSLTVKARSYGNYQERFGSSLNTKKNFNEEYLLMDRSEKDVSAQEMLQDLSEIERDLTLRGLLWQSQEEWDSLAEQWTDSVFDSLNVENLQKNVNRFTQTVYMLEKSLPSNEVVPRLQEKVMNFKQVMPVVTSLRNPSLKARHWEHIENIIGRTTIREDKAFTLGNLLDMNINRHKDKIQDVSTTASNEATLERMLQKVIDVWQATDFRLVHHPSGVQIIAGADDILAMLEESQVTIGTIRGSRYVTPIKGNVEDWERKLTLFARTLDEWMMCQRNWLYLEQIFTTPDIQRQLPNEYKMFSQVDKTWKDVMRRTEDRPNALRSATAPGVLEMLQSNNTNLEKIQKCLEEYLETKRLVFPRFYFLSNDEMLDILAQSKNPDAVQPHLVKCFGNIRSLEIKTVPRQPPTVRSLSSAEGETIPMPRNVRARGPVEQWLCGVETGMFDTVKKHLKVGLQEWNEIEMMHWVTKHPGQVVLTVSQIQFNKDVVLCLTSDEPVSKLAQLLNKMLKTLTVLAGLVSSPLAPHKRLSINALLTVDVHNRDIINSMVENSISRKDDFEWTRQLRYEWDEQSNNCNVLQSNACFVYGYEYLGCSPRLVITPLTDRCYLTLTGAMHLHLGGSPAGPAGTGKTETVKDLAKAMGKQCVVFNCSEGLDFKMLGKFFSGMAQSGSWCCFDEFNRIDLEVLSVVAQQIHTIKTAKDQQVHRFLFEGRDIRLNMTCGVFITMNPSYAGRVELPDNLKSLFRQVAMMVPDYALIAEIMLFSEGFTAAKSLSTKIVNLYQLASKQLSQQDHYDFGMRAIKSVLVMAGQKKRQHLHRARRSSIKLLSATTLGTRSSSNSLLDTPDLSHSFKEEAHILIHSLRDVNLPKFLAEDVPLFESILDDLFPGIKPPLQDLGVLEKAISMAIRDLGYQHWPSQTEKVKQLYNQILVRHGVMMVGPTGGGKTATRNILQRALTLLPMLSIDDNVISFDGVDSPRKNRPSMFVVNRGRKGHVEVFTVNPKCVSMGELYGETDPNTFEWTDGLIAAATRRFAKQVAHTPGEDSKTTSSVAASSVISGISLSSPSSRAVSSMSAVEMDRVANEDEEDADKAEEIEEELEEEKTNLTHWKWMVLDGPVDTTWVENLNTVLDDSKILCLANGERISLTPNMRLIFEVDDLSKASPATISRCAMVYMDPADLGWTPFIQTWLSGLPRDMPSSGRHHLQLLFQHTLHKGVKFLTQHSKHLMMPTPYMCAINCLCSILSAYFDYMTKNVGFGNPDKLTTPTESRMSSNARESKLGSRDKRQTNRSGKKHVQIQEGSSATTHKSSAKIDKSHANKQSFLDRNPQSLPVLLNKLYVFAFTWSFGGNFRREDEADDDGGGFNQRGGDRKDTADVDIASEFDNFVHELFEVEPPIGIHLPASSHTIYSYFVDLDSGNFVPWDNLVATTQSLIEKGAVITIGETMGVTTGQQSTKKNDHNIVATVDTVRYSFLTALLLMNKSPVLLTGESGVGKTAIMKDILTRLSKDGGTSYKSGTVLGSVFNYSSKNQSLLENISILTKFSSDGDDQGLDVLGMNRTKQAGGVITSTVQFSAQTSSRRVQQALSQKLIKKGRDTLGAPKGKRVLLFVDDLNMPAPEQYGAQPPLELLRQFMDLGGFYDTTKLLWKDILDVTLISACGPPGGGRNDISPRLLRHFCMLAFPQPSTRSLQHIYQVQLGRFFQENDFLPEVKEALFPLVSAGIAIYYRMTAIMKPTPAKIHYTFNIRDLSQVIRGLMQADPTAVVNGDNCAQLFAHEATRVFHDRLTDLEDRKIFFTNLSDTLHDFFKVKWTPEKLQHEPFLFADFLDVHDDSKALRVYRQLTDHARLIQNLEEYYLRQNIGNSQAPQLVFFKYAVEHILRAARVFGQPGGHMLMVGLDGTGKSTTVQLASYIAGGELYKLTLTRGYGLTDFREDLKKVCRKAGVTGTNMVFLLSDGDIAKESFLEDVNSILNSGEVPDLFDNEEMDGIAMEMKDTAAEAQVPETRVLVYEFFIQRVKANLHLVLTMSPAGAKFRQRCRMNPSLINCCTIDWFDDWDQEACLKVAQVYFSNAELITQPGQDLQDLKRNVTERCVDMHRSVEHMTKKYWNELRRRYYVTPSSYMEFIRIYAAMLLRQKTQFVDNKERLLVGLSRLSEANVLVGTMQEELVGLGPQIEEKAKATEVLLKQLEKDQEAVDEVRALVEAEEAAMNRETQIVQQYADECQQDLATVLPILQQAIESLDALDKADIAEIRVYNNPPELVMTVMSGVCVLLGVKPDWASAKHVLADPQFLRKLVNFDKSAVSDKVFQKVKRFSRHPDFTPEKVSVVSEACKSMCQWVLALEHYHEVYKMAKPKQKKVEEAKEALKLAQEKLALKQASLNKIQQHMALLQQQYQDSVAQREGLKERKKLTALRLERASVLITALSDEKVRWASLVEELDDKLLGIVGDTLVSAGSVAYLGAFTSTYRHELISTWLAACRESGIPVSADYELIKNMASPNQVMQWHNSGLPQDSHSTENAIIVLNASKWPLLIDPQGQGSSWIKEMEGSKLKIVGAGDPNFMRTLERAIRVGEPVLLKDVTEDLDPSLKPILLQETTVRGGHFVIKLGDTEIEYNENFKLYMSTGLSNPHYLPSVCINTTVINFTVTYEGLQEQLLSSVVKQERPLLEKERTELLNSIADDLQLLRDLEDKTLSLLQKSQGNILDDQDLIDTLQKSKGMSTEIHDRVEQSEDAEKELNTARQKYLPVAARGAVLYFVLADLANVDVMYQFSLKWFKELFSTCIRVHHHHDHGRRPTLASIVSHGPIRPSSAGRRRSLIQFAQDQEMTPSELATHMKKMIDKLTWNVYHTTSMALFAKHQLMFSFVLATSIMRSNAKNASLDLQMLGEIAEEEWTFFLQGNVTTSLMDQETLQQHDGLTPMQRLDYQSKGLEPPRPKFMSDKMWQQCQFMEATFPVFSDLLRSVRTCQEQWEYLAMCDDPFLLMSVPWDDTKFVDAGKSAEERLVLPWQELVPFHRLLLIKVLRPDMLTGAVRTFVHDLMGPKFVSTGTVDLREVFEDSSAKAPLIFILSPGSDPASQLLRFAKELRGSTLHLDMISLGRGQGPRAEEFISKAQILKGRWLFLQNCHLAASWMPKLQSIVDGFGKPDTDVDPQFRLWLSSKPDPKFPVSILQNGIKMTVEPPGGVKANLQRSFASGGSSTISDRLYEDGCVDQPAWKSLLLGLCFFNAVIHERKKYGRLGWNIPYEFNDSDLEVSVLQLQMLLSEHETIPWPALLYLTGEVTYGGRVTDDNDRRCLHSLLQKFYHPKSLSEDYVYSPDKVYHPLPPNYSYSDVKHYIDGLPETDSPELCGMNQNAEKAYLEDQSQTLLDTILGMQPRLTSRIVGSNKSNDELVVDMAQDMLSKIPPQVETDDEVMTARPNQHPRPSLADIAGIASGAYFRLKGKSTSAQQKTKGLVTEENTVVIAQMKFISSSALFIVLRQEIKNFTSLLLAIHKSLLQLIRAVKGEIVMSLDLEEAYNAILHYKVPLQWKQISYESCKGLGAWVSDLVKRVDFFSEWCELTVSTADKIIKETQQQPQQSVNAQQQANTPQVFDTDDPVVMVSKTQPRSFWLSAFFFPQGFLSAILQNHARRIAVSVDSLHMQFTVKPSVDDVEESLIDVKQTPGIKEAGFKGAKGPQEGVYVFGLFLDGARWDLSTSSLADSLPGKRFSRLPQIHFKPSADDGRQPSSTSLESPMTMFKNKEYEEKAYSTYQCPLYRTSTRAGTLSSTGHSTNYVTSITLPSNCSSEFWVLRGVAVLCQLDD